MNTKRISNIITVAASLVLLASIITTILKNTAKEDSVSYTPQVLSVSEFTDYFDGVARIDYVDTAFYKVFDSQNVLLGKVYYSAPFTNSIRGFAGPTPLLIVTNARDEILSVKILNNSETQSYIKYVQQNGLFDSWNGLTLQQALTKKVDAVSGATFTSNAVISSFDTRVAVADRQQTAANHSFDWSSLLKQIAVLVVVVLALICFFFPHKTRVLRIITLILSVLIVGFWRDSLLSLAVFYGWLTYGIPWVAQLALWVIALLAIVLPFFFGKAFYCTYLCPFGALQFFAGKLRKNKISFGKTLTFILLLMRKVIFILLLLLIALGVNFDLAQVEPFGAFGLKSVTVWMGVFAVSILLVSVFVSRPWCQYFCPTGQLLDLFRHFSIHKTKK